MVELNQKTDSLYSEIIKRYFKEKKYQHASMVCEEYVVNFDESIFGRTYQILIKFYLSENKESVCNELNKFIELNITELDESHNKFFVYEEAAKINNVCGEYSNAITQMNKLYEAGYNSLDKVVFIADMHAKLKSFSNALYFYKNALKKKNGNNGYVNYKLAILEKDLCGKDSLRSKKQLDLYLNRAEELLSKQIIDKPDDLNLSFRLAKILILKDCYDDAIEVLNYLVIKEYKWEYEADLAKCYHNKNDFDKALSHYKNLIQVRPESHNFYVQSCKAYRAIGEYDKSIAILQKGMKKCDHAQISREILRSEFAKGNFEKAENFGQSLIEDETDVESLKILCCAYIELNNYSKAQYCIDRIEDLMEHVNDPDIQFLKYEICRNTNNFFKGLTHINKVFYNIGCQGFEYSDEKKYEYDLGNLKGNGIYAVSTNIYKPYLKDDSPLVSVIMTAYNAAEYIETAVDSIMNQSYKNIELIIVEDLSKDETRELIEKCAKKYNNLRYHFKTKNEGTYVAKNIGLLMARGEYIALQDSDDLSHPDRIAMSIAVLERDRSIMGVTCDWLRMTSEANVVIKSAGKVTHICCISFVFRRKQLLDSIGFFDSVRIEADMEYIKRATLIFGAESIKRLSWPLLIGRSHASSLTMDPDFGITRIGFTEPRVKYQSYYKKWHNSIKTNEEVGMMPFPLQERIFNAPKIMLPEKV